MPKKIINIAIVDDHVLLRNGLASLIKNLSDEDSEKTFKVIFEASNGVEMIEKLAHCEELPEIISLDINMPEMDGYEACAWLKQHHPNIKVLALSMYDAEFAIIRMLKNGAKGYLLKDSDPKELKGAFDALLEKGFYYSELISGKLINALNKMDNEANNPNAVNLTERELLAMRLMCTELTLRDIAIKMDVSPRTIDGYREVLFEKLKVKTRVGVVIYAIKNKLVDIS